MTAEANHALEWSTLEDFGYHFNNKGQLRDIKTDKPFEFNVHESRSANQECYEKLGEVVEQHVYKLLEDEEGLLRTSVPVDASNNEPTSFISRSEDSFACNKLLLLIHGSGVVRAGQWARRLIINHSLESGTQLPYIKKARKLGFGVLVLNTNYNSDKKTRQRIRGSCSPEDHFIYVWEHFVSKSQAEHIAIIAHSYGGAVTTRIAAEFPMIMRKTFAVAFTDSVHYRVKSNGKPEQFKKWMRDNVRNWASSPKPLNTPLRADPGDCFTVSAGTTVHEETSWKAYDSVWKFIDRKWDKKWENETGKTSISDTIKAATSITTSSNSISSSKEDSLITVVEGKPPKKAKLEDDTVLKSVENTILVNERDIDEKEDETDENGVDNAIDLTKTVLSEDCELQKTPKENKVSSETDRNFTENPDLPVTKTIKLKVRKKKGMDIRSFFLRKEE